MSTSRVLMLNYEYPPLGGGAAPATQGLATTLEAETEWSVDVVTMGFGDLPSKTQESGVTVHRVPSFRSKKEMSNIIEMASYVPTAVSRSVRLARRHDYDVIHSHFIIPTGVVGHTVSSLYDIPHVITSHGSDVPGYNPDHYNITHKIVGPVSSRIARSSSAIITPSVFLKELVSKHYKPDDEKLSVIPYGFDPDKIRPADTKDKSILMTGRLLQRKGFQFVIEAMSELNTEYEIRVAGEGPYKSELVRLAEELEQEVTFLGWLEGDELHEEYAKSKMFVLPSSSDNFPVSLLEAMSGGNAVITSDSSGCPEVVGDSGILVEPGNVVEIRNAIQGLIDDPERIEELQNAARERIKRDLSWTSVANEHVSLYQKVLSDD